MNLHRAHTEILILALAAVLVLLVSVATKTSEPEVMAPQVSSQPFMPVSLEGFSQARPAAVHATPASLQAISTPSAHSDSDWLRADSVEVPAKQTRWVF